MKVFALTKLGKRIASTKTYDTDEMRVLQFIKANKRATSDELDGLVDAPRLVCRRLKDQSMIVELTT